MDKYTKKFVKRNHGVSKEGIPNRTGGSWPNHPSMRYELPIPFSPGADNVTDAYREGWDRIFGPTMKEVFAQHTKIETSPAIVYSPCDACGEPEFHNVEAGVYTCEIES